MASAMFSFLLNCLAHIFSTLFSNFLHEIYQLELDTEFYSEAVPKCIFGCFFWCAEKWENVFVDFNATSRVALMCYVDLFSDGCFSIAR